MTLLRETDVLSDQDVEEYRKNGFLLVEDGLTEGELERIRQDVKRLYDLDHPGRVFEKDGTTIRGIHGSHEVSELFARLVRLPRLLLAAQRLLCGHVYVHQCKVNAKRSLQGDIWPWHQDYVFWARKDGMRQPRVVNAGIFLDDATEHNGPLLVLPGSHHLGTVDTTYQGSSVGAGGAAWASSLSADLDFAFGPQELGPLVDRYGIHAITGRAGSLLFFDARIIHGSGANMTARDRCLAIITYNSVDNALEDVPEPRPWFLASRDFRPLHPLMEEL